MTYPDWDRSAADRPVPPYAYDPVFAAPEPSPPPPPPPLPPAPRPPGRGRRALVASAAVLAVVAAGVGVGYTAIQVRDADRTAATQVWQRPEGRKADGDAARAPGVPAPAGGGALGELLLPMPGGYHLGPDIDEFGNDTVLSAGQAEAVFAQSARGLPPAQRRLQLDALSELELKGMAIRSYADDRYRLVAEVQLARVATATAAAGLAAVQEELTRSLGGFEPGPRIEGYDDAACFIVPPGGAPGLEMMTCFAAKGDVLVSFTAYGPDMSRDEAASLLERQLGHIDAPGKSI